MSLTADRVTDAGLRTGSLKSAAPAIFAFALGGFGIGTTEFATMGLLPQMGETFGVDIPTIGYAITLYALGVVVGAPIITALAARVPRKGLLIVLMAVFAVGNGLSSIAANAGLFIASRFFAALPHGAYFGVAAVVAASLVSADKRGRAVAFMTAGLTISNIVGVPIASFAGTVLGWRVSYAAIAVIGVVTMLAIMRWVPRIPAHPEATVRGELRAFRRPQVLFALGTGAIGFGGMFAAYSYVTPLMTHVAGLSELTVPFTLAAFGLGMTFGNLVGGRLADWSTNKALCGGLIAVALSLVLYALGSSVPAIAVTGIFLVGFNSLIVGPALNLKLMDASPDAPNLAASSLHSALNIGNALGAWLGGIVIAAGFGFVAPLWVGVGLSSTGLVVALVSIWYARRGRGHAVGAEA